jgi:hypothetical protein
MKRSINLVPPALVIAYVLVNAVMMVVMVLPK